METDLIKLKIKKRTSIKSAELIKKTFINACKLLDTSSLEPLIEDESNFEKMDKHLFIQDMKERFEHVKSKGIKEVKVVIGICELCFKNDKVYEFYADPNVGKPVFAYNIKERNGIVDEIFLCNFSNGYKRDAQDEIRANQNITFPLLDRFYKSLFKK